MASLRIVGQLPKVDKVETRHVTIKVWHNDKDDNLPPRWSEFVTVHPL